MTSDELLTTTLEEVAQVLYNYRSMYTTPEVKCIYDCGINFIDMSLMVFLPAKRIGNPDVVDFIMDINHVNNHRLRYDIAFNNSNDERVSYTKLYHQSVPQTFDGLLADCEDKVKEPGFRNVVECLMKLYKHIREDYDKDYTWLTTRKWRLKSFGPNYMNQDFTVMGRIKRLLKDNIMTVEYVNQDQIPTDVNNATGIIFYVAENHRCLAQLRFNRFYMFKDGRALLDVKNGITIELEEVEDSVTDKV